MHCGSCGGMNLKSPTGGAANRIPSHLVIPSLALLSPMYTPQCVGTTVWTPSVHDAARLRAARTKLTLILTIADACYCVFWQILRREMTAAVKYPSISLTDHPYVFCSLSGSMFTVWKGDF